MGMLGGNSMKSICVSISIGDMSKEDYHDGEKSKGDIHPALTLSKGLPKFIRKAKKKDEKESKDKIDLSDSKDKNQTRDT